MTPVKHNLSAVKGEFITLTIGYNSSVEPEDLFSCVRKFVQDDHYEAKFNITVSKDNLAAGERCRIILKAKSNNSKEKKGTQEIEVSLVQHLTLQSSWLKMS